MTIFRRDRLETTENEMMAQMLLLLMIE